jgi:1,4-alpha-glucan branching enzyme
MLFQGQELLEDRWFDDTVALDWTKAGTHLGTLKLHRDLIDLRRGGDGATRGLRGDGVRIRREDPESKLIVVHRWHEGGPGDDVIVVVNLAHTSHDDLVVGVPSGGRWRVRFNSDALVYAPDIGGKDAFDADAVEEAIDDLPFRVSISVGPYSVVILSQDP